MSGIQDGVPNQDPALRPRAPRPRLLPRQAPAARAFHAACRSAHREYPAALDGRRLKQRALESVDLCADPSDGALADLDLRGEFIRLNTAIDFGSTESGFADHFGQ